MITTEPNKTMHHGRNIKRFRDMLALKQEALSDSSVSRMLAKPGTYHAAPPDRYLQVIEETRQLNGKLPAPERERLPYWKNPSIKKSDVEQ